MARSTKLNSVTQKKICDLLKQGHFLKTAAVLAGVSARSAHSWLARGRKEEIRIAGGDVPVDPDEAKYLKFLFKVEEATAQPVNRALKKVMAEVDQDVSTAKWYLSHRQPDTWGGKRRSEKPVDEVEEKLEEEETEKKPETFSVDGCHHAEIDCACPCDQHYLYGETVPEDCICWQYHNPPEKSCGCLDDRDLEIISDIYGIQPIKFGFGISKGPEFSRLVPGRYKKLKTLFSKNPYELFKRGNQIIKSSDGDEETIEIIH